MKDIFFDLDDTIFDFKKAEAIAMKTTLEHYGIEPTQDVIHLYSVINQSQWELLEKKLLTKNEVKIRRFKLFLDALMHTAKPEEVAAFYENRLSIGHYFIEGAEEMLRALHGAYRLHLVSNGVYEVAMSRLNSSTIVPLFDHIFISGALGVDKPAKEFFDACFAQISDFDPAQAIIVGDSLTSDILGGKNAGITTIWFNPHQKSATSIIPDYEINNLGEIEELLHVL